MGLYSVATANNTQTLWFTEINISFFLCSAQSVGQNCLQAVRPVVFCSTYLIREIAAKNMLFSWRRQKYQMTEVQEAKPNHI